MNYSSSSLSSGSYLTLERAMEISDLTLPELKRAIVLGFIKVADIGNTTFVDSLSLDEYLLSRSSNTSSTNEAEMSSVFFQKKELFQEDNHTSQKEREVFREALARDMTAGTRMSIAPFITVGFFVLLALVLALPPSQNSDTANHISAEEYYARANLKEITTEKVSTLLTQTSSAYKNSEHESVVASKETGRRDYFALHRENLGASAVEVWIGSIKEGIKKLALSVYETIEAFTEPLH